MAESPQSTAQRPGEVVPASPPGRGAKLRLTAPVLWLRCTLLFTPAPTARVVRSLFAKSAEKRAAVQLADAPTDVDTVIDGRYGPDPDELMDVYTPHSTTGNRSALPAIVWTHGGAFVGGTKDEIGGYLRMLAGHGFVVVGLRYTLAPEGRYPTPVRQVMRALGYLTEHAEQFRIDPNRLVLAGDSAGAQITAQVAALVTNPGYARQLGVTPSITGDQLRGVELCCGVYNLADIPGHGRLRRVVNAIGWVYSGTRRFRRNVDFTGTTSIPAWVTADFPPAFVTAGNGDPLLPQSQTIVAALRAKNVAVETLFYPPDYQPTLGHEYQFELHLADGRTAFDHLVDFARRQAN